MEDVILSYFCLGKRTEDSEVFIFNNVTLINIEEFEILRHRITFKPIHLGTFRECAWCYC